MSVRAAVLASALVAATVAAGLLTAPAAEAKAKALKVPVPTIAANRQYVLQSDPVVLNGRVSASRVSLERRVGTGAWVRIGNVARGAYHRTVLPVAGKLTSYRVGTSRTITVHSTTCAPLPAHGTTSAWFNLRKAGASSVAANWGRLICSAAPNSSIALASMFIFGGKPSVDALVADLRNVATYRGVHVHVLVQKSQFPARVTSEQWTWSQFTRAFSFADIRACDYGCTVAGPNTSMHSKFMTLSRSIFGGSAVVESSLNWSPQQFDRQNGSAVYFYNDPVLYNAYYNEFVRDQHRISSSTVTTTIGWRTAGHAVSYAFDPSAVMTDPITNELATLVCRRGDYVDVVNANVTRGRLVRQLNRLRADGCAVRVITEQYYRPETVNYTIRHMITHDKYVLVKAHTRSGAVTAEVMTGSEDYRPASMVLAEEQLVRVRLASVVSAYAGWFSQLWPKAV